MREIKFNLDDSPSKLLKGARDNLLSMRKTTTIPKLLQWQIHLYDFILSRTNPDDVAEKYLKSKNSTHRHLGFNLAIQLAAKEAGFMEPMPQDEA